jgi:hypothetical protein
VTAASSIATSPARMTPWTLPFTSAILNIRGSRAAPVVHATQLLAPITDSGEATQVFDAGDRDRRSVLVVSRESQCPSRIGPLVVQRGTDPVDSLTGTDRASIMLKVNGICLEVEPILHRDTKVRSDHDQGYFEYPLSW